MEVGIPLENLYIHVTCSTNKLRIKEEGLKLGQQPLLNNNSIFNVGTAGKKTRKKRKPKTKNLKMRKNLKIKKLQKIENLQNRSY